VSSHGESLVDSGHSADMENYTNSRFWRKTLRDGLTLPLMAQRTVSLVPGARLSLYADAGHAPFFDDSARFNDELASFVREANRDASKKVDGVEKE
jgi:pimeloyl-ACP methyl ester carboxylesterase